MGMPARSFCGRRFRALLASLELSRRRLFEGYSTAIHGRVGETRQRKKAFSCGASVRGFVPFCGGFTHVGKLRIVGRSRVGTCNGRLVVARTAFGGGMLTSRSCVVSRRLEHIELCRSTARHFSGRLSRGLVKHTGGFLRCGSVLGFGRLGCSICS